MEPAIRQVERSERQRRRLPALIGLAITVIVGATWFGLFAFLGVNTANGAVEELEALYVCDVDQYDLDFPDIGTLSTVYTADEVKLGQLTERNSLPVALEDMPDIVVAAMLSAEDKSFYDHEGIDFTAIGRAVLGRVTNNPAGGGSTITQQVVKQNFLTTDQTIERKICEAVVAAEVERLYSKDQILEFWANSVFFGSNAYGIRAASLEYFGKELDELSVSEAALLPIPIRNPTFYHPRHNPQNALAARNRTIDRMVANGYLLPADAAEAKAEPLGVIAQERFEPLDQGVMIAVRRQLLESPEFAMLGESREDRKIAIFGCPANDTECEGGGGLKIDITLDHDLQTEAKRILHAWFRSGIDGPTGAIASIDNGTGAIRVLASGVDYGDDLDAGQRPYDLASYGERQPGSAFKPFTLAAALESGSREGNPVTLGSYWDDSSPVTIDNRPEPWTVHNANGSTPKGLRTLDSATYHSTNTVYARLIDTIGPTKVVEMANRLGIKTQLAPNLSITLGAGGASPQEMASAYSTLANYGSYVEPFLIERITAIDGTVLYEHRTEPREVLQRQIAAAVVGSLQKVVTNGTGQRANIDRPQAGKTGTATDSVDVWFVGFVPQMTTAVWAGYADGQIPMQDLTVWNDLDGSEQFYRSASGGTLAAPIWKQFMTYALADVPIREFRSDPPGTDIYRQTPFSLVPELALSTTEAVEAIYHVGLAGVITEVPSTLPAGTLVGTVPLPGTLLRQGSEVQVQVSNGIPPEIPMIDLRGLTAVQVNQRLLEFTEESGLGISWSYADVPTTNPTQHGRVIGTTPPSGAPIGPNESIVVKLGTAP